jgi:phosphoserine phosphatase
MTPSRSSPALPCAALLALTLASGCTHGRTAFRPIEGFDEQANARLAEFFEQTRAETGRKVAVFDGDGTVFGQVPHYLADECLYQEAKRHPEKRPEVIEAMTPLSNVSHPYVQHRVFFFEGDSVESVRELGDRCFREHYAGKIYPPMRGLVAELKRQGFEVWIITASPEALYQRFLGRELGIPEVNVVGVKSVVHGGKVTRRIVEPVPQDEGKLEAIETFVQTQPLLAGGNSRGDKEMIESSRGLKLIVNPDEFVAPDQTESVADYARRNGWLIVRMRDVAEPGFPGVSGADFKIRQNKANP